MATTSQGMKTTVLAASYNMVLQMVFRLGTFFMNAVLMRYITKEMLGVVNVRLLLLHTTINFVSREAFRKACLSRSAGEVSVEKRKRMVNLIWVSVVVGLVTSLVLGFTWMTYLEQPSSDLIGQYRICTVLFALASVIELISEPMWIFGQSFSFVRLKVIIDGMALLTKCLVSVLLVILVPSFGLISFGVATLLASSIYTVSYYIFFTKYCKSLSGGEQYREGGASFPFTSVQDFLPCFDMETLFDSYYTNLVTSFYKQSLIKQFLTEGERYIMTLFNILSFAEQGVYDVINNLGSLAARIIFMPIEESYYVFYSLLLTRGKPGVEHTKDEVRQAATSLSLVLKVVSIIGYVILVFGYSYSFLLLQLYGGSLLTDGEGPDLLRTYCLYVLIIAVNGITECFMFASMHQTEVDRYNYKMFVFSIVFLLASLILTKYLGAVGFILGNCINMLLRIGQNVRYIQRFFLNTDYSPLSSVIPSPTVTVSLLTSLLVTAFSERTYCCAKGFGSIVIHVAIGAVCLLVVILAILLTEHELTTFVKDFISKKREEKKKERTD